MFSHQVARLQSLLKHPLSTPRPGFKNLNQVQIFSTACKNGTTSETLKLEVIKSKAPAGPGRRRVCRRDSRAESPPKCPPHAPTCAHAMLRAMYLARYNVCVTSDLRIRHKPISAYRSIARAPRGPRRSIPDGRSSAYSARRPRRAEIVSATNRSFLRPRFVFDIFVALNFE